MSDVAKLIAAIEATLAEITEHVDRIEMQRAAEREWLALAAAIVVDAGPVIPADSRWLQ